MKSRRQYGKRLESSTIQDIAEAYRATLKGINDFVGLVSLFETMVADLADILERHDADFDKYRFERFIYNDVEEVPSDV